MEPTITKIKKPINSNTSYSNDLNANIYLVNSNSHAVVENSINSSNNLIANSKITPKPIESLEINNIGNFGVSTPLLFGAQHVERIVLDDPPPPPPPPPEQQHGTSIPVLVGAQNKEEEDVILDEPPPPPDENETLYEVLTPPPIIPTETTQIPASTQTNNDHCEIPPEFIVMENEEIKLPKLISRVRISQTGRIIKMPLHCRKGKPLSWKFMAFKSKIANPYNYLKMFIPR
uniref:Uncharacterized protein n=3 Tax=Meloidogyne enterolobii TaxID=390850 RepID=A0A6V7YCH0_MELEN|nr:unnamed protein product [Meloidogyne enterolobii]CAD2173810.1 unnamed protein product [Meloidogyne enterolobii]CAD2175954.1 unnamed protein product [Meloidogyne enterolobii]CAD2199719.1 unnamed protein product [Meloidogyne enterolobii]CAD2209186.1 unnamed protein product [Meloidogyne enterolobii]